MITTIVLVRMKSTDCLCQMIHLLRKLLGKRTIIKMQIKSKKAPLKLKLMQFSLSVKRAGKFKNRQKQRMALTRS